MSRRRTDRLGSGFSAASIPMLIEIPGCDYANGEPEREKVFTSAGSKGESEMKTKRSLWVMLSTGLVVCAMLLAYLPAQTATVGAKSKDMVGSWNVIVTVVNQNATFPGLLSFFSDGNLIADETPSPLETSGHGNWVSTGKDTAAYTFVALIGSSEPNQWLKLTVSGTLIYDPKADRWNGPFTIVGVDQDGDEFLSDTGTMSGTRITAQP